MGINHFQETKFENELSGKAKLKARRMNGRQSEFFSARGLVGELSHKDAE